MLRHWRGRQACRLRIEHSTLGSSFLGARWGTRCSARYTRCTLSRRERLHGRRESITGPSKSTRERRKSSSDSLIRRGKTATGSYILMRLCSRNRHYQRVSIVCQSRTWISTSPRPMSLPWHCFPVFPARKGKSYTCCFPNLWTFRSSNSTSRSLERRTEMPSSAFLWTTWRRTRPRRPGRRCRTYI